MSSHLGQLAAAAAVLACLASSASTARASTPAAASPATVTALRWQGSRQQPTVVRIALQGPRPEIRHTRPSPTQIVIELAGARLAPAARPAIIVDRLLADVRGIEEAEATVRVVLDLWRPVAYEVAETPEGIEVVLGGGGVAEASAEPGAAPALAQAPAGTPAAPPLLGPPGQPPAWPASPGPPPAAGQPSVQPAPPDTPSAEGQPPAWPGSPGPPPAAPAQQAPGTEWAIEERFTLQYQNVHGERSLSFLNQGVHYAQELDVGIRRQLEEGRLFEGRFSGLLSDDSTRAPEQFALQALQLRLAAPDWELQAGDVLLPLSNLSLSLPIKGLGGWKEFPLGPGLRVTAQAGVMKTRWEELWGDNPLEFRTRYVAAARVEQRLTPDVAVGFNYLWAGDDTARIKGAPLPPPVVDPTNPASLFDLPPVVGPLTTDIPPVGNHVWSLDVKARLFDNTVTVEAEAARSQADLDLNTPGGSQWDNAYLASVGLARGSLRAAGRYLRVEPRFFSGGSFVFVDLEEWSLQADYDFPRLTLGAGYVESQDNLGRTKPFTTRSRMPEARISLRSLPGLPDLTVDLHYRARLTRLSDGSVDETAHTAGLNTLYRLGPVNVSGYYEYQHRDDAASALREAEVHLVGASLEAQLTVERLVLSPGLRYEWFTEERPGEGVRDTTSRYEGWVTLDWPGVAVLVLAGQYGDHGGFFGTDGLANWLARAQLTVRLLGRDDRALTFGYERRNSSYVGNARDYGEEIASAQFRWRF